MAALNAKQDAQDIHNAIHVFTNDTSVIIGIIARRPNWHLQKVREEYEKLFEKDLVEYILHNTHFNFRKLLSALVKGRAESRAEEVYRAVKGLGTDEHALIDVIIHNSDKQLEDAKQFFRQKYEKSMDEWVKSDTSFNFEKILLHALKAKRDENVRPELIDSDAETIYTAGEGKWGTDEATFIEILTTRSWEHIRLIDERYKQKRGHGLDKAVRSETSGWFKVALLACVTDPIDYWAQRCHEAIQGLGTDDKLLVRCFSENSKPFLVEVAKHYQVKFNKTLQEDIKGDTSGHYRELLETLIDLPESERLQY
jgi:hypothetical protein